MEGRPIRVQYRELHQKVYQSTVRNPNSTVPKLAPASSRLCSATQRTHFHNIRKVPATLGQLSGSGGLTSDALNAFCGFDPITGIANGVVTYSE